MEIGPIGHVVNLNLGALRETPVELWDYEIWVEMSAVATCSLDVRTAESLRIEYKPLPADAKRIVDKLNASVGGLRPSEPNNNLAGDLNAETRGEPRPQAAGARGGRQAAVAATAAASATTAAAGAAGDRAARLRSAASDRTAEGPAGRYTATPTTAKRIRAARAGLAGAAEGEGPGADTPGGEDGGRGADAAEAAANAESLAAAAGCLSEAKPARLLVRGL